MNNSDGSPDPQVSEVRNDPPLCLATAIVAQAVKDARGKAKGKKAAAIEWLQSDHASEILEDLGYDTRLVRRRLVEFVRIRSSGDEGEEVSDDSC